MGGLKQQLEPQIKPPLEAGLPLRPPLKPRPLPEMPEKKEVSPLAFELQIFDQVKKYLGAKEVLAFEKLVRPYLKSRPRMEEFPYENRKDDINLVGSRKEKALKEDTFEIKTSYIQTRIFEALLGTIMELHWLPEAFLSETSDYDDWINGADAVLEAGPFKIMIDFTCQKDKKRLHKKIEGINARIERGELGKLKYFKSQVDKRKHALIMLPIVIIALSATTMRELLDLYLTGKKKELENHWARSAIAEEIIAQVGAFKRHINNPTRTGYDPEKARFMTLSYNRLEKVIIKMANIKLPQAEETKKQPESQRPDSVYQALMAAVAEG